MKHFFTFCAAFMLCVGSTMAAKLQIPEIMHVSVKVQRNGSTLSNGATIVTGDKLTITYTADNGYVIKENKKRSITKSVTVTTDMLCEDLTSSIDGTSQGFTAVTATNGFEGYATSGWMIHMPTYSAGVGLRTLSYTYTGTGQTTLSFARGLNSYFINYGQFIFRVYINDQEVNSAYRDYRSKTISGEHGTPLIYDTITFNATGNDVIKWSCMKMTQGGWADNEGRAYYVGQIHKLGTGDYYVNPIAVEEKEPAKLHIPQSEHQTVTVMRGGTQLNEGDAVKAGDVLDITYNAVSPYVIKENKSSSITKQLTLTNNDFTTDITYDIKGESQYYTRLDGTKVYYTKVTPDNPWGDADPMDTVPFWPFTRGYYVNMPPFSYTDAATGTAILTYNTEEEETTISSIINMSNCCIQYGKFKVYCKVNGTTVNSTYHDYTTAAPPDGFYTLLFDTISVPAGSKIEWVCEKTNKGSWIDDEGRAYFIGDVKMHGEGDFTPKLMDLAFMQIAVEVEFQPEEHCQLDYASLNNVDFTGGQAYIGDNLTYKFSTEYGYQFTDGSLEYTESKKIEESMLDESNKVIIKSKQTQESPRAQIDITLKDHVSIKSFKLNGEDYVSGTKPTLNDQLEIVFVTDEGYYFCDMQDTIFTIADYVRNRVNTSDSVLTVKITVPDVCVAPPYLSFQTIDQTTMLISWTGLFDSYKLFVKEEEIPDNPDYYKGAISLNEKEYTVTDLTLGKKYYVYLKGIGDISSDWVGESFVAGQPDCRLFLLMNDSYCDGWNGNGLNITDDNGTTFYTLASGCSKEVELPIVGDEIKITWVQGSYTSEVSFAIYDTEGKVILEYQKGDLTSVGTGTVLYDGSACYIEPLCKAEITDLTGNVEMDTDSFYTKYSLTWKAENAVSYEVAITQQINPSEEYLKSVAVVTTDTTYSYDGKDYGVYNAFVRAKCENSEYGKWSNLLLYKRCESLTFKELFSKRKAHLKDIDLDYVVTENLMEHCMIFYGNPTRFYQLVLTDTTIVSFHPNDENNNTWFYLYKFEGDSLIASQSFYSSTLTMSPGKYVIQYGAYINDLGEHTISLTKTPPMPHKNIELDYTETGDFSDGVKWYSYNYVPYAKSFDFTLTDSTCVEISCNDGNYDNVYFYFYYYYEDGGYYSYYTSKYLMQTTLPAGKYRIYAVTWGDSTDTYTLSVKKVEPIINPTPIRIEPDVRITDKLDESSLINYLNWAYFGKIYEMILTKDTKLSWSIENQEESCTLLLIPDSLTNSNYSYVEAYYDNWYEITLSGLEEGRHYYFVPVSYWPMEYTMTIKADADWDNPHIKDTLELNTGYESEMSIEDGYTYYHNGYYEAYKVMMEKGKTYQIWLHTLPAEPGNEVSQWSINVHDPGRKTGSYSGNGKSYSYGNNDGWLGYSYTADTTAYHNLIIDALSRRKALVAPYELRIQEIYDFSSLMENAPTVITPYEDSGLLKNADRCYWTGEYLFHTPKSYITNAAGSYDAVAYNVSVPAGDTLFVEFGGNKDATVHILDKTDASTIHSPVVVNETAYTYPYESAMFVNTTDKAKDALVIGSFNDVYFNDAEWNIRIAMSGKDMQDKVVTAVADKSSVTINTADRTEALTALASLNLKAVDADKKDVCSILNDIRFWNIDFDAQMAYYEVNNSDLPFGYTFSNFTEWIEVALNIKTGFEDIEVTDKPRKVLYNGVIYIVTQHGIYNIFGVRLE